MNIEQLTELVAQRAAKVSNCLGDLAAVSVGFYGGLVEFRVVEADLAKLSWLKLDCWGEVFLFL